MLRHKEANVRHQHLPATVPASLHQVIRRFLSPGTNAIKLFCRNWVAFSKDIWWSSFQPLFVNFQSFQTANSYNIQMRKNYGNSFLCGHSKSQQLDNEAPFITTRLGLLPNSKFYCIIGVFNEILILICTI